MLSPEELLSVPRTVYAVQWLQSGQGKAPRLMAIIYSSRVINCRSMRDLSLGIWRQACAPSAQVWSRLLRNTADLNAKASMRVILAAVSSEHFNMIDLCYLILAKLNN